MSNVFKELREKRGLSQSAVADFIGISRQMYNKYENGEVEPSLKAVKALCTLYAVSYDVLLGESTAGFDSDKTFLKQEDSSCTYSIEHTDGLYVSSPAHEHGPANSQIRDSMYGTANVLAQILELLPKLLYSEKARLLTTVAQSMSSDVEAGQLARWKRPVQLSPEVPEKPTHEEFLNLFEENRKLAEEIGCNSHGIKWSRDELHER